MSTPRIAGFLCLYLTFSFSGYSRGPHYPVPVATNPHVYSSEDPEMQAYESEDEEIERLVREIKTLRAKGREEADIRKLKSRIREL